MADPRRRIAGWGVKLSRHTPAADDLSVSCDGDGGQHVGESESKQHRAPLLTQALASTYADVAQREHVRGATMAALGLSALPEYAVRVVPRTGVDRNRRH